MTVTREVPFASVYKMYHIPARTEQGYYVADILTDILSSGKAGHLFQRMVKETEVASSVRAFSWGAFDPGIISIDFGCNPTKGISISSYKEPLKPLFEFSPNGRIVGGNVKMLILNVPPFFERGSPISSFAIPSSQTKSLGISSGVPKRK